MTDPDLQRLLKNWEAPEPSESHGERTWFRVRIAFLEGGSELAPAATSRSPMLLRAGLLASIVFSVVFAGWISRAPIKEASPAEDRQILAELKQLFPNELGSVVLSNGDVEISLTNSIPGSEAQPMSLRVKNQQQNIRVLTFSGNRVTIPSLPGRWEVLATGEGGAVLVGANTVVFPGTETNIEAIQL